MKSIVSLTLNPAIDASCEVQTIRPTRKIRTNNERFDPGGGGINVARVIARLGGRARAIYLAGGAIGSVLKELLDRDGIERTALPIAGHTRISNAVLERDSGLEYRFVPQGPRVSDAEWRSCLAEATEVRTDYLVLSGSLPQGVPVDFYARLCPTVVGRGTRVILDTSGPALKSTLERGGVYLVKPSLGEMEQLVGRSLTRPRALAAAAAEIVRSGQAEFVAVTMGRDGALLAWSEGEYRLPAIAVEVRSAVGAGDSFLGGMTFGLASGLSIKEAFRLGIACGAATVLTPGTDLCHRPEIDRLLAALDGA